MTTVVCYSTLRGKIEDSDLNQGVFQFFKMTTVTYYYMCYDMSWHWERDIVCYKKVENTELNAIDHILAAFPPICLTKDEENLPAILNKWRPFLKLPTTASNQEVEKAILKKIFGADRMTLNYTRP